MQSVKSYKDITFRLIREFAWATKCLEAAEKAEGADNL